MSSDIDNSKYSSKNYEEGVSIRAQKRKRALQHYQRKHKVKKPCSSHEELSNETTYYIENGLRKVYPYYFNFSTYVKGRWLGKTVLDVYKAEFKQDGIDPADEIENGNITVNGKKVPHDFVLGDNMMLEHKCHRHEMPVLNEQIEIIQDTDELLVVNKPASIPVHPCGRYRYNSITMLLKHELGYNNLRVLYRLDRLTSGVLIMPKTTTVSRKLEKQLGKKELYKEYVCRVEGRFPDGEVVCNEPLGCMSYKLSLYRVDPEGKPSSTTFTRLSYNGKTSVVKCIPHTGRTHQIRVHLQFLGYPICNDPLYNSTAFGPNKGKGGVIERLQAELEAEIMKTSNIGRWKLGNNPKYYMTFGKKKSDGNSMATDAVSGVEQATSNEKCDDQPQLKTESCGLDEITEHQNKEVKHRENTTEKVHGLDVLEDINDDSEGENKGHGHTETDCPNLGTVNISKSSELEEKRKDIENVTEEPAQPFKRVKGETNTELSVDISGSCVDGVQEKCDTSRTEQSEDCSETSQVSASDNTTDFGSESEGIVENKGLCKDFSGKPVLAQNVTDLEVVDSKMVVDEFCQDCKYIFEDPKPEELILFLHAVKYKGADWEYSTDLPYWAQEDFDGEKHLGT